MLLRACFELNLGQKLLGVRPVKRGVDERIFFLEFRQQCCGILRQHAHVRDQLAFLLRRFDDLRVSRAAMARRREHG